MVKRSLSTKIGLFYIWERLNGLSNNYLLLFLNDFLNDEQKLAILAYFPNNYRRFPVGKILAVPLTI